MDPEFYKKVTPLRQKITDLETDILLGKIAPLTVTDFNTFFLNVSTILDELKQVYHLSLNTREIDKYFKEQKKFIEFLYYFMDILKKHHEYYEVTEEETIRKEWNDIVCILQFNQLEQKMNSALFSYKEDEEVLLYQYATLDKKAKEIFADLESKKTNNLIYENNHNRVENYEKTLKEKQKEYLDAVANTVLYMRKEYTDERRKDTEVDEEFFKQLTLTSKIRYLNLILKNIEAKKTSNKKEYIKVVRNGIEREIPRRYKFRYGSIKKRMEDLLIEYEKEKEEEVLSVSSEVEKEIQEEKNTKTVSYYQAVGIDEKEHEAYVTIQIEMNNLKREMTRLVQKAKDSLKFSEAIPVKLEEQTYHLLPEDVEKFTKYHEEYQIRKNKIATFSKGTEKEYADKEDVIYQKICALKESGADKEQIKVQLHKLRKEQYRANRGKKNAQFRNLLFFIQSLSIPKNLEKTYLKVAFSPEAFVRSKEYSDSVKKKALGNCLQLFKKREESYAKVSDVALTLEGMSKKINAELESLPKDERNVLRIKKVKKAKRVLQLKQFVDENAVYIAIGFVSVLVATSSMFMGLSYHHHVTEKAMIEKYGKNPVVSSETNQEKVNSMLAKLEKTHEEKTLFEAINEVQEERTIQNYGFTKPSNNQNTVLEKEEEDSIEEQKFVNEIVNRQKEDYAVMTKNEENLEIPEDTQNELQPSSLEKNFIADAKMNQKVSLKADTYVVGTYEDLINFDEKEDKNLYTGDATVEQTGFVFKKSDGSYIWISNTDPEWESKWEECVLSGAEAIGFRGEKDLVGVGFFPMDSVEELGGQSR